MDPDSVFCRGNTIFHCQQYFCSHVQEYGHAKRNARPLYESSVSPVGDKTSMESVRGYNQEQEMVDNLDAGPHVGGYVHASVLSAPGNR